MRLVLDFGKRQSPLGNARQNSPNPIIRVNDHHVSHGKPTRFDTEGIFQPKTPPILESRAGIASKEIDLYSSAQVPCPPPPPLGLSRGKTIATSACESR
jgi:hypothetical protein